MKRTSFLALCLCCTPLLMGSDSCDNATQAEAQGVERQQAHFAVVQPVPFYEHSPERDYVTQLYDLRQENVSTHSVWRSYDGTPLFDCPSIGYGIPYDLQLTNPLKRMYNSSSAVVEQAEPNGLFSSKNTSATWVLCIEDNGSIAPVYVEAVVNVYPWPMDVDYETGIVRPTGKSSITLKKSKTSQSPALISQ
jgi:hypothetical protein